MKISPRSSSDRDIPKRLKQGPMAKLTKINVFPQATHAMLQSDSVRTLLHFSDRLADDLPSSASLLRPQGLLRYPVTKRPLLGVGRPS